MEKTDVNNNTALAIFFLATAVVVIGGLIAVPTMVNQQSAEAKKTQYCFVQGTVEFGVQTFCEKTLQECEEVHEEREQFGGKISDCAEQTGKVKKPKDNV